MDNLPEAPVSINFRVAYKGIEVQATKRDKSAELKPYLEGAKVAIDWALTNGFEIPVRSSGFPKKEKKYIEGKKCPLDGGRLIEPEAGTNRPIKCENNKYDWATKTSSGCQYREWPNSFDKEGQTSAEIAQKLNNKSEEEVDENDF